MPGFTASQIRKDLVLKSDAVFETDFPELNLLNRGKVRDIYEVDDTIFLVATDRLSALHVILPDPIPGKGKILTHISLLWF